MMTEYEKNFTDVVYQKLKERCKGKVTVYIDDDKLYIKVFNGDVSYIDTIDDFSHKLIMNELNIGRIVDEFVKQFKYYLLKDFFW